MTDQLSGDPTITPEGAVVVGTDYTPDHLDPGTVTPTDGPVPPVDLPCQVLWPLQAILRTLVQTAVGAIIAQLMILLPGAADALTQVQGPLADAIVVALTAALASGVAWVMSRPQVNAALTSIGLGAHPSTYRLAA